MKHKQLFVVVATTLLVVGTGAAHAGNTIDKVGALACVNDKWDVKEPDKGHKLVDYAGRCVNIPDEPAATPIATDDCVGNYEYMPDGSWKGTGTCNITFKGGDKLFESWEEVRTSRNMCSRSPAAPANIKAPLAAAHICTRV
jgi:hypothetical protein